MRIASSRILPLLLLFVAASCTSSDGNPPDRGTGRSNASSNSEEAATAGRGGLWDMLADERRRKEHRVETQRIRQQKLQAETAKGRTQVPEDQRRKMEGWWRWFLEDDERWTQARHEWRDLGPGPTEILVENLLIVLVRAYDENKGVYYRKARSELYELSSHSAPYLVAALRGQHGDDVVRRHCVELLGLIGRPALDDLTDRYTSQTLDSRLDIVRAVAQMGPAGRPESTRFLGRVVKNERDFRPRLAAIQGLGRGADPDGVPVLVDCLRDGDLSVRKFAAASLGAYVEDDRVVDPLIRCLTDAEKRFGRGERAEEVAENCVRSLRRVTGISFKRAADWQRWRDR